MARCPFCDHILRDAWVKRMGASIMGRTSGEKKARNNAKKAADKRWREVRFRETHGLPPPKTKRKKKLPVSQPKRKKKIPT
jgi:hypothetical protein